MPDTPPREGNISPSDMVVITKYLILLTKNTKANYQTTPSGLMPDTPVREGNISPPDVVLIIKYLMLLTKNN
jgi:hypothetical protein